MDSWPPAFPVEPHLTGTLLARRSGGRAAGAEFNDHRRMDAVITPYLSLDHDRWLAEASFLTAWEYAPIGIKQVSPEGKFLRVNRWICDLLGYCEEELLAKTSREITHPEDLSADEATVQKLIDREID